MEGRGNYTVLLRRYSAATSLRHIPRLAYNQNRIHSRLYLLAYCSVICNF